MYDELVKRVRQVAEEVCDDYDVDPYIAEQRSFVIEKAADAIEEFDAKYNKALKDLVKLAKNSPKVGNGFGEWIPVTERLPEKREWVLVRSKLVKMKTDFISNDGTWYTTPGVTHWMPLPEPPKEE